VAFDPSGLQFAELLRCLGTLLAASLPLSALMLFLVRHAARLRPAPVVLAGALAVAALTATAMALLHPFDASLMILLWTLGGAALVLAVHAALGRHLLRGGAAAWP
jgi:hypothetical protein